MALRRMLVAMAAILLIQPLSVAGQDASASVMTERFALRSDARVSLHHFLIAWAAADAGEWPGYAAPIVERGEVAGLIGEEREVWDQAALAYTAAAGRSHVFDEGLVAVRDWASGQANVGSVPDADRALTVALERALPVYERHWWSEHDRSNRAWIGDVSGLLETHEQNLVRRLESAYGASWPENRIAVDVVPYANDVGAYSTGGRITIASGDAGNQAPQSLELVFHEASHVDPLEVPLRQLVDHAFQEEGGQAPNRLWHDVIFFTTGEVTAIALEAAGQDYTHYGHATGLYRRGERWAGQLPAFEQYLRPFLRSGGAGERVAAVRSVARALMPR